MSDFFSAPSDGAAAHVDSFPIDWHPHRGQDLCSYMIEGVGRHADSMGNRESFASPGMQWCSAGSGIEHAEGGATPRGAAQTGFQLWLNVPSARKMDAPRYGTVGPSELPLLPLAGGVTARVVSGPLGAAVGPFLTVQPLQIIDYVLPPGASLEHVVPPALDNAMAYVYRGSARLGAGGAELPVHHIAHFAAGDAAARAIPLTAGLAGASLMLFAGKRLNQPIAWHGPFVMTTQAEIAETFAEYRRGAFPPVRTPWNYKTLADFPADHPARASASVEKK